MPKRSVCFIITSHIHYARSIPLLYALKNHPALELRIVVAASALLPQYGDVQATMEHDGFTPDATIIMTLAGGSPIAMAKTAGIGITEFATAFGNLKPDMIIVRGDRYEVLSAAIAAAYMNIPVAHIEGGDVSGNIDESVRHAITKLSHIHLTTNEDARRRVLQMGEDPAAVHVVGCPELEVVAGYGADLPEDAINKAGVGDRIDLQKPFLTVLFHPVTTEKNNRAHTASLLEAVRMTGIQTVWFWPNVDAGTDDVAKAIRVFRETQDAKHIHFLKYLAPEQFIGLLRKTACLVGNSSAGIKECSYLGVPVVNVGTRQEGRLRGENVVDVDYDAKAIATAIQRQVDHRAYPESTLYFRKDCSKHIADIVATVPLSSQKRFFPYTA